MANSMTGFGRAEVTLHNTTATAEIKSVNSRYCDISVRMPHMLKHHERKVHEWVQQHITRGKINVSIHVDLQKNAAIDVDIDETKASAYADLLKRLQSHSGITTPVTIQDLMSFDGIFVSLEQDESTINQILEVAREAVHQAMDKLNKARHNEGQELRKDMMKRIGQIEEDIAEIKTLTKERVPEARERFYERINKLMNDMEYDKERLEQEIAIQADKIDVTEELVRLESHIKFFRKILDESSTIGQRLHFLLQEMNREVNTIGSKANSAEISQKVVHVKETLEKIREQVQNIE